MEVGYACQNDLLSKFNLTAMVVKASNFLICLTVQGFYLNNEF